MGFVAGSYRYAQWRFRKCRAITRLFGLITAKPLHGIFTPTAQEEVVVYAKDQASARPTATNSAHGGHKSPADHHFLADVAKALSVCPQLSKAIIAVESARHPTGAKVLGYARKHFPELARAL